MSTGTWVELTLWGVPGRNVPLALTRMATDRPRLRRARRSGGLRFAKLLGTGSGETFALRDADPRHWGLITAWDDPQDADRFRAGAVHRGWSRLADEQLTVQLEPMASRGSWARQEPFAVHRLAPGPVASGPVAALTRARLRPSRAWSFRRAVPPIAAQLREQEGLLLSVSIGEAPIGLAGTFSVWTSQQAMSAFAHRTPAHRQAIQQTGPQRWYAEELFTRFSVRSMSGRYRGQDIQLAAQE